MVPIRPGEVALALVPEVPRRVVQDLTTLLWKS
jgi:hypothetical protein